LNFIAQFLKTITNLHLKFFFSLFRKQAKLKESLKKEMQNVPEATGGIIEPISSAGLAQEIALIASVTLPNKPKFVGGGFSKNISSVS
jgi:hypothetical protein